MLVRGCRWLFVILVALLLAGSAVHAANNTVHGQAILEYAPRLFSGGLRLDCDGRRLHIRERTQILHGEDKTRPLVLAELQRHLKPGSYVEYEGRFAPDGSVEVTRFLFWRQTATAAETRLRQRYRVRIQFPGEPGASTVLAVGKKRYRFFSDRVVQKYLARIGARLVAPFWRSRDANPLAHFTFSVVVVDAQRPGATAYPSGVIVIHSGVLLLAENEAQVAFLLGHELAHLTQQHASRQAEYHRRKLLALRWGTAYLGWVAEQAIRKGYERKLETQADRLALAYLAHAGYDPREGYRFLQRLGKVWRFGLSPLLWSSHASFSHRQRSLLRTLATTYRDLPPSGFAANQEAFAALRLRLPRARIKAAQAEVSSPQERQ